MELRLLPCLFVGLYPCRQLEDESFCLITWLSLRFWCRMVAWRCRYWHCCEHSLWQLMGYDAPSSKLSENALGYLLLCWCCLPLFIARKFYPNGCCFAFIQSFAVLCPITRFLDFTPFMVSFLKKNSVLTPELPAIDCIVRADVVYVLRRFP